jgi:hypothetical protein
MVDDGRPGDTVLAILSAVRRDPAGYAAAAGRRGITVDQLTAAAIAGAVLEMLGEAAAVAGEGPAAPGRTRYCLGDVAGRHCLGRAGFIPIGSYRGRRGDIPHFAGREEAEVVVGWLRAEDAALRVMVVRPGCRPVPLGEEE